VCRRLLEDLSCEESSEGLGPLNHSRESRKPKMCVEVTSQRRIAESILNQRFLRRKLNGHNSPRRTPEIARTIGSKKVAGKLNIGQIHLQKVGFNVDR
jgi:hypothetical protein